MAAVHKKHETKPEDPKKAASAEGSGEQKEPVVVSDIVTETIEVVEETSPQAKSEAPPEALSSKDPLSDFKEEMIKEELSVPGDNKKRNYMWPILLIFIITILLLIGVFLYRSGLNTSDKVNVVTISPTPVVTLEPTKTVDLAKYEIEILNGSEVTGEASRQKANLAAEGFAISSIGNADNSDYTDTIIKAKKEVGSDFIAKLKETLNTSFTVGETETLSDDASVPIIVILGVKK